MLLNTLFDVLRGWPREGAIDETFPIHQTTPGTPDVLHAGNIVSVQSDGSVALATTPNRSSTNSTATWVVITDSTDFDASFVGSVTCLRANAEFKLDPSNFNASSFPIGSKLTFNTGLWTQAATNNQIIGEVLANNSATDGTLVVYYSGGDTASF